MTAELVNLKPTSEGGEDPAGGAATVQPSAGCTLTEYSEAKKLPLGFLQSLGLTEFPYLQAPAVRIPYLDMAGNETAVRFRTGLHGKNRFRWRKGDKPCLYGLDQISGTDDYVVLAEGESDTQTLWFHNFPAIGLPSASGWKEERDAHWFDGFSEIYVVIEPDQGGLAVTKWLSNSSIRHRTKLIMMEDVKDPSELHVASPDEFVPKWNAAMDAAIPWGKFVEHEEEAVRKELWENCKNLAQDTDILGRFSDDMELAGVVGENHPLLILYLALTSRFLDRPVSVAVKGPSSGGKSYITEQTLKFFPSDAFYELSAMSERALIYDEEPLSHRFLVIYEATGLSSNFASYLVRSLLSEGRIRYKTVEKTTEGLRSRTIEREGPTGLITTTTSISLHPENETRLLSVTVTDTPEQTKAILQTIAQGKDDAEINFAEWHAFQRWLGLAERRVTIPFADELADMIPPVAVRLRRDFAVVLSLIKAHAILHQATRERDTEGRIVATLEDYAVVRILVADLVSEGVERAVSDTIRETVNMVQKLKLSQAGNVKNSDVAAALKIDKSSAQRRVRAALDKGFLINLEDKKGKPAKLDIGDPLPEEQDLLPTIEALSSCTVAVDSEG